jgi:Tol biopolymer transport system component
VLAGSIVVLAVALLPRLQGILMVGTTPAPRVTPTLAPSAPPPSSPRATGLGLAYALDGDIYVANSDGTNPVRIADGDPDSECGALGALYADRGIVSPDGRYIAYRSWWFQDCPGTVFISDPAGRLIASFPGVGWDIAWSPDSTHLATWVEEFKTIGIYRVDGALESVLDGSRMCCGDYDPIWSPDGAAAVMVKEGGPWLIWELPIDGGTPVLVPRDDPRSSMGRNWRAAPAYSPDGTRAVVISGNALNIVAADGTHLEVLVDETPGWPMGHAMWSPTGNSIAYIETRALTFDDDGSPGEHASVIRFVDPRTGTITGSAETISGRISIEPIGFSPDGDSLLFGQSDEEGQSGSLWVVNTDGSDARMLVDGTSAGGWVGLPADTDAPAAP